MKLADQLKLWWAGIKAQIKDLWDKDKGIFLLIAIAAITVKFRDLLVNFLVSGGKREEAAATRQDAALANQENQANQQANALAQQAQNLPSTAQPVTDNWYEKKDDK